MRSWSARYVAVLLVLAAIATLSTLTFLGVPPFDNLQVFILTSVASVVTLLVLGVVGGAFVGMLIAHRMLASRQFTPFERAVLESLESIKARLDALEKRVDDEPRGRR